MVELTAFMVEMSTRQGALEEQVAKLSKVVLGKWEDQNSNEPLEELANLKHTSSVEEYQSQFQSLLARTSDLRPLQQVNLFTAGLKEDLRIDIEMQQHGNLGIAIVMARALERKQGLIVTPKSSTPTPIPKPISTESGISTQKSSNTECGNSTQCLSMRTGGRSARLCGSSPIKVHSSSPFIKRPKRSDMVEERIKVMKRLEISVMAERRIARLCFYRVESYRRGRKYKGLLWIEVLEFELEDKLIDEKGCDDMAAIDPS